MQGHDRVRTFHRELNVVAPVRNIQDDLYFHSLCSTLAMKHGFNISNSVHGPENDLEKPEIKLETNARSQPEER